MRKDVAIIDIKDYNELKLFQIEINKGSICFTDRWGQHHYMSKDDFHKEMIHQMEVANDKIKKLEEEIILIKTIEYNKLNFLQRFFSSK